MATLSTVYAAFVARIEQLVAAHGLNAIAYAGWPEPGELRDHLATHLSHISVSRRGGSKPQAVPIARTVVTDVPEVNIAATVSASQLQGGDAATQASALVTLAGTPGEGLNFLFKIGDTYVPYHPEGVLSLDTMLQEAAGAINAHPDLVGVVTATALGGAQLLVQAATVGEAANALEVWLRIGGTGRSATQVKQNYASIDVHIWSYDDATRSLIFETLDDTLAEDRFLTSEGDVPIRIMYAGDTTMDAEIRLGVYRRILHFTVQYGTTRSVEAYTVLEGAVTFQEQ